MAYVAVAIVFAAIGFGLGFLVYRNNAGKMQSTEKTLKNTIKQVK